MSDRGKVLIIEDAPDAGELAAAAIAGEAFEPVLCATASTGVAAYLRERPVAVILDWGLPDRPGVDVCREIRAHDPLVPIIFVSGRNDEASLVRGLDAGADDFIIKPFRTTELMARIEAHVRKARAAHDPRTGDGAGASPVGAAPHQFGEIEIDLAAREVRVAGETVGLGPLEFRLLEYLVLNVGVAISRDQIMNNVYGYDAEISTERADLLARRLRHKLGEGSSRGGQLVAVPGYGYRWDRRSPE